MYLREILAPLPLQVSQLVFINQSSSSDANPTVLNCIIYHWQEQNHCIYPVFLIWYIQMPLKSLHPQAVTELT